MVSSSRFVSSIEDSSLIVRFNEVASTDAVSMDFISVCVISTTSVLVQVE